MTDPTARTILISGGSRGLGLGLVEYLLGKGCRVATFARKETEATKRLAATLSDRFHFKPLDATDDAGVMAFVDDVAERFGGIWGLINNAAIGQDHLLAHMPVSMIHKVLQINLTGPILLTRAVVRQMLLQREGGRIVNISSICGTRGFTGLTAYSATKGGLDAFTRSLAREVGARGILVNSLAPGFFMSEMSSVLGPGQVETIRRRTPTERMAEVSDLLPMLDLLLFEETNITGQTLPVDGGASV